MQGSIPTDSDGIESSVRSPNKKGFVQVDISGVEYELSDFPPAGSYVRIQRIHAICTDPTGSVGGSWDLLDSPSPGNTVIISLPQPILAANLAVGKELIFEFPTPFSSLQSERPVIKPSANLGKWKIAAFGYYTKVAQ
jgi:hypothetical protein